MTALSVPARSPLRVVGDVHGDARGFAAAVAGAGERFLVQLGDLTDGGPQNAEALRIMFRLLDSGRGLFLLGNHELKLARALAGRTVRIDAPLAATLAELDPDLRARAAAEIARAPAWLRRGHDVFVHGGFHTGMLDQSPPPVPQTRVEGILARALYGEATGRLQPDGYPERSLRWVDRVPAG